MSLLCLAGCGRTWKPVPSRLLTRRFPGDGGSPWVSSRPEFGFPILSCSRRKDSFGIEANRGEDGDPRLGHPSLSLSCRLHTASFLAACAAEEIQNLRAPELARNCTVRSLACFHPGRCGLIRVSPKKSGSSKSNRSQIKILDTKHVRQLDRVLKGNHARRPRTYVHR